MSYESKDGLSGIAEAIAAGMALGELHEMDPNDTGRSIVGVLVPEGAKFEKLDLEAHLDAPRRKKGNITLTTAQSFIDWVNRNKTPETVIYAKESATSFQAIFNGHEANQQAAPGGEGAEGQSFQDGAPGWGDFTARYDCPLSPEWQRWMAKSQHAADPKRGMSQAEFMAFLEDNLLDITNPDSAYLLQAARSFEVISSGGFKSAVRLENGDVKFNYADESQQVGSCQLPSVFQITIPVFKGGVHYTLDVNLRYRTSGGSLTLWYELVRPHKSLEHAFNSVLDQIAEGTDVPVFNT